MTSHPTNWAGNITFSTARVHRPQTVEEIQSIVRQSKKVRVLGSRHSFNDLADSTGDLISLENLAPTFVYDPATRTATVNGSATYGQVCAWLHGEGAALHNMASLPHITIAGAVATATHGSGDSNGNLATAVAGLEIVNGEGEVVEVTRARHPDQFAGAVVGLGGLGVVTKVTLDTLPTYVMQQEVYENLPLAKLLAHFDEITAHAYSVSLFTDWQQSRVNSVWIKRQLPTGAGLSLAPSFFEATLAPVDRHPVVTSSAVSCTPQMGVIGPWHERLPHFRVDHVPSSGRELQTEYFVPRAQALAAIEALVEMGNQIGQVLRISEVRTVAADSLWMSPSYGQRVVGLHFTWQQDWEAVRKLLPVMEERLMPLGVRPHWGKLFTLPPAYVQGCYPKLAEFRALLHTFDPAGKFRNRYLDTYIFGEG